MSKAPEHLLIEAYKQIEELKNKLEEAINLLGQQKLESIDALPTEVKKLVQVAIQLTPQQRDHLMLFLNSLKESK